MNEDQRQQGSRRRHRNPDSKKARTTGEEARAKPSMSIPGFTEKELFALSEKLRMLGMAMDDWSPIARPDTNDAEDTADQEDAGL